MYLYLDELCVRLPEQSMAETVATLAEGSLRIWHQIPNDEDAYIYLDNLERWHDRAFKRVNRDRLRFED